MKGITQIQDLGSSPLVEDVADVVVLGTGAGGATAARVLSAAGLDVVMVEEGPWVPHTEHRLDMYSSLKSLWRDAGFQAAEGRAVSALLQGSCVGGSTAINSAITHRCPEKIHHIWGERFGATERLTYDRLNAIWDQIDAELHVAPTPREVYGRNNDLMTAGFEACGFSVQPTKRNVSGCQGTARCGQGCPTQQRQSMNVSYVPRALASGARLYATCRAERLLVEGGRGVGIEGRFWDREGRRAGPQLRVRARRAVVVACSAIQTPLFLLDQGIGKQSGQLGRNFQSHPGTAVAGIFDEPVHMWFGATQGVESLHFWEERYKVETIALAPEMAMVRLPGYGRKLVDQVGIYPHLALWGGQVRAEAHGRVRRGWTGRPIVTYTMTPTDCRRLKTVLKTMAEAMFAAGARALQPGVYGLPDQVTTMDEFNRIDTLPDDPRLFHCILSHLFGTARMGKDPRQSVVDVDGRLHELQGVYVADASVLPTNMGVNPQHTILGIAWGIAEDIANQERLKAAA